MTPSKSNYRTILLLSSFMAASLSVVSLLSPLTMSGQESPPRARLIDTWGSYANCPIKIIGVETGKGSVTLGKSFLDGDDWLKGLTVKVANSSGKALTHIGIKLIIDPPEGKRNEPPATWDLWYGISPFYFKPNEDIPPAQNPLVQPGEVQPLELASEYNALTTFLSDVGFSPSIDRVHVSVYTIGFADGTAWGGQLYRRDKGSKRGWAPMENSKSSPKDEAISSPLFTLAS